VQLHHIQVEDLTHRWGSKGKPGTLALDNVNCGFAAGKITALIGPSGCGKSTLLLMLRGLLKPTQGRVTFLYKDEAGRVLPGALPKMATVWQAFNLLPWRPVLDNVAFGLELAGVGKAERHALAREAINAVKLTGFENHSPKQLSGGMRQRVGLARALVTDPSVLLLDEPFGALDAQTRLVMQGQLIDLVESTGRTIVLVTHSIEEAILLSDRVLVMTSRPGRIAADIAIDIERPRSIETQDDPRFAHYFRTIYEMLKNEVEKAMAG
jgi:ABC-type nitrate/sulfonate/bicarbonate transport system ATPase subunit